MQLLDNTWFWLLILGFLYLGLFLLIYLQEKFSTLAIVTIVIAVVIFLFAAITGLFVRVGKDVKKINRLLGDEIAGRLDTQRRFIGLTLDALQKVGNSVIKVGDTTVAQTGTFFKETGKGLGRAAKDSIKAYIIG